MVWINRVEFLREFNHTRGSRVYLARGEFADGEIFWRIGASVNPVFCCARALTNDGSNVSPIGTIDLVPVHFSPPMIRTHANQIANALCQRYRRQALGNKYFKIGEFEITEIMDLATPLIMDVMFKPKRRDYDFDAEVMDAGSPAISPSKPRKQAVKIRVNRRG